MSCNCGKKRTSASSGLRLPHEVWKNNTYTGRSFSSLFNAQAYAERVNGEVRSTS